MELTRLFQVAVALYILLGSVSSQSDDETCRAVQSGMQAGIFWIGLLRSRFILITNTLAVYDLSTSALDSQANKVTLSSPKALRDIYPALGKRMDDNKMEMFFEGGQKRLCIIDQLSDYLYSESQDMRKGSYYDLVKGQTSTGQYAVLDQVQNAPMLTMSSSQPLSFFAIYYDSPSDPSGRLTLGRFLGGNSVPSSTTLQIFGGLYYMCQATQVDRLVMQLGKCKRPFILNAMNGFADEVNFYVLATNATVFVFAKSAYNTPGTEVRVYKIRFEDFFVCGSSNMTTLIVAAVAIGVLLLCIFCFCFIFFIGRSRGRGALVTTARAPPGQPLPPGYPPGAYPPPGSYSRGRSSRRNRGSRNRGSRSRSRNRSSRRSRRR